MAEATGSFAVRVPLDVNDWQISLQDVNGAEPDQPLRVEGLDEQERMLVEHAELAATKGSQDGPYADYLDIEWRERGEGSAVGRWRLGPHLWNRSRHVHGGAMFGGLAEAVLACLPRSRTLRLVEQHVQLIRPGIGEELRLEARLIRRGQRLVFAEATALSSNDRVVSQALATMEETG